MAQWLTHLICNEKIPGSIPGMSLLLFMIRRGQSQRYLTYSFVIFNISGVFIYIILQQQQPHIHTHIIVHIYIDDIHNVKVRTQMMDIIMVFVVG